MTHDDWNAPRHVMEAWIDEVPFRRRVIEYVGAHAIEPYLVGGTVRDALLRRPGYDLDLAVRRDAMALARRVADTLGAAYVAMDAEHDVGRVVVRVDGQEHHVDLAGYRAADIEADLRARDFTVNAMAVAVGPEGLGGLLDPTGGRDDLARGVLRVAYGDAFTDDPVRILRGVRLYGSLDMVWHVDTEALARRNLAGLHGVSPERVRDELARMLDLPRAAATLHYAADLGALTAVLPELAPYDAEARGMDVVQAMWGLLQRLPVDARLHRYAGALNAHWDAAMPGGRPRRVSLLLAALSSSLGAESAAAVARRLHLSNAEARNVEHTVWALEQVSLAADEAACDPVWAHRYYRQAGEAGLDGALLALAVAGDASMGRVSCLLDAWFEAHDRVVDPPPLLSGRDLMRLLNLSPGPEIGRLLQALREEQAAGRVRTRKEAIEYARAAAAGAAGQPATR